MKELKYQLIKKIKTNFMIIFISMIYTLFENEFMSSPLTFFAVQWSRWHDKSAI